MKYFQYIYSGKVVTYDLTLIEKLELLRFLKMFELDDAFNLAESGTRNTIKHDKLDLKKCLVALEVANSLELHGIEKTLLERIAGRFKEMTMKGFGEDLKAMNSRIFEMILKTSVCDEREYLYRY